jgi:hypothetical protein
MRSSRTESRANRSANRNRLVSSCAYCHPRFGRSMLSFGLIDFEFLGEEGAGRAAVGDVQVIPRTGQRDEQQAPFALQGLQVVALTTFSTTSRPRRARNLTSWLAKSSFATQWSMWPGGITTALGRACGPKPGAAQSARHCSLWGTGLPLQVGGKLG